MDLNTLTPCSPAAVAAPAVAGRPPAHHASQARVLRLDPRLDHLVYLLYDLSYAEAQAVEPSLAQCLTKAEYAGWPQA